ncbi:MAG: PilN domain-containing protein [Actinobacteria bacterium]|nr:PilN domain-containing protein [Actinomycetota bacterium]
MRPINLLPREDRGAAAARRRVLLVVAVGFVYVAGLAALTVMWNGKVEAAEDRLADQQARNATLQAEVSALSAADELRLEYQENAALTAEVLSDDVAWGRLLNDFGRLIPERVWLENFVGAAGAGDVAGVVGRITVAGTGFEFADVSAWLRSLDEARFPGVIGSWVTNATEAQGLDGEDTVISFSSTAGLTDAAISNRVQERVPEVSG